MKIEYISVGDIQLEINKHREVLHPNRTAGIEGEIEITESDVSAKPALVQAVFNAMKAVTTTGEHRMISFDSNTATIKVDGQTLTPDADVSGFNQEVQTFFNTIYSSDDAPAVRLYRSKQIIQNGGQSGEGN